MYIEWENGFWILGIIYVWILHPRLHEDGIIAQNKIHNANSFQNYWISVIKQNYFSILKELTRINITTKYLKKVLVITFDINPFAILKQAISIFFLHNNSGSNLIKNWIMKEDK